MTEKNIVVRERTLRLLENVRRLLIEALDADNDDLVAVCLEKLTGLQTLLETAPPHLRIVE